MTELCMLAVWSAPVLLAGLCAAGQMDADGRSDRAVAFVVVCAALTFGSVHLAGLGGWLHAGGLFATLLALCVPIIVATLATSSGRARLLDALDDLLGLAIAGVSLPARQRSLVVLGPIAVASLSLWTLALAYLAPSSGWDGLMYHEPMVGLALQNASFAEVDLGAANPMLTQAAGYPRLSENIALFFVVAWDRRLIDIVPSLMLPCVLLGAYVSLYRLGLRRLAALGIASGFALLPALVLQLRSTYVDVGFAAFTTLSVALAARERYRPRDLLLVGLSLGLLASAKSTGFLVAPLVGLFVFVRMVGASLSRPSLLRSAAVGIALMFALGAPTYARNAIRHGNPVWPGAVHHPELGIEWDGPLEIGDMNMPTEQAIDQLFRPPVQGQQFHDTRDNGYGNIAPFVLPPLGLLGLFALGADTLRRRRRRRALLILALALPLVATFALTPARHWARLNVHSLFALFILATAPFARGRGQRWLEALGATFVIGGLITLYWSDPAWDVDLERAEHLASLRPEERAIQHDGIFTLMPTETAAAREAELTRGALVLFDTVPFMGVLWNEHMNNRVEFLDPTARSSDAWLHEAERRGARWVVLGARSRIRHRILRSPRWERVGPTDAGAEPPIVYRQIRVEADASPGAVGEPATP